MASFGLVFDLHQIGIGFLIQQLGGPVLREVLSPYRVTRSTSNAIKESLSNKIIGCPPPLFLYQGGIVCVTTLIDVQSANTSIIAALQLGSNEIHSRWYYSNRFRKSTNYLLSSKKLTETMGMSLILCTRVLDLVALNEPPDNFYGQLAHSYKQEFHFKSL